jgi:UDP-glucuronate 4-epimerase
MNKQHESKDVILVTGGAGFIGSFLCEKLISQGNRVVCIDNFNNYYLPSMKWDNLVNVINNPLFTLIEGDIRDNDCLTALFKSYAPNLVIHLAAMAGVRPSLENPELYYDVNINGTYKLLEACRLNDVKHFIFASSSSVYGNNKKVPFSESDPVDNPISPYAYSKKAGELLCHLYYHLFGMSIICLRFFTVYGPRQRPDLAIRKFVESMINKIPITVYGDGSTRRDFTFIDDIIDGIMRSIDYVKKQRCYEIFNLGESSPIILAEMISEIEKQLGVKAERIVLPMQAGDVDITFADIDKSRNLLGYDPKTAFEVGLKKFITWYLSNR